MGTTNKNFKKNKLRLLAIDKRLNYVSSFKKLVPALKKIGSSYKCKSPFNPKEKTPSFFVNPDKHIWHCFSTNQGGSDIVSFVMKKNKLNFIEALDYVESYFGLSNKIANKSILKSLVQDLNKKDIIENKADILIKRVYEGKLIKFLDRVKKTVLGDRYGYWQVRDYIFDEFDKTTFYSDKDFKVFIRNCFLVLRRFRPKNHGIIRRGYLVRCDIRTGTRTYRKLI